MKLYTIMDTVAKEAGPPFMAKNDGTALRSYYHTVQSNKLNQDEYILYRIGAYNPENMEIISAIEAVVEKKDDEIL